MAPALLPSERATHDPVANHGELLRVKNNTAFVDVIRRSEAKGLGDVSPEG